MIPHSCLLTTVLPPHGSRAITTHSDIITEKETIGKLAEISWNHIIGPWKCARLFPRVRSLHMWQAKNSGQDSHHFSTSYISSLEEGLEEPNCGEAMYSMTVPLLSHRSYLPSLYSYLWALALSLTSYAMLDKSLSLSKYHFPYLLSRGTIN